MSSKNTAPDGSRTNPVLANEGQVGGAYSCLHSPAGAAGATPRPCGSVAPRCVTYHCIAHSGARDTWCTWLNRSTRPPARSRPSRHPAAQISEAPLPGRLRALLAHVENLLLRRQTRQRIARHVPPCRRQRPNLSESSDPWRGSARCTCASRRISTAEVPHQSLRAGQLVLGRGIDFVNSTRRFRLTAS